MVRGLILIVAVALTAGSDHAAQVGAPERGPGALSGIVLSSDGLPVTGGSVNLQSPGSEIEAAIDQSGRFRFEPLTRGAYEVRISASGLMTHRLKVLMPASGALTLPPIRLSPASYFRVRLVSPTGEPILAARILRQSYETTGRRISERPGERATDSIDSEGSTIIGPLPRGITLLAVDAPPFARMRLPDVRVTGETPLQDGGTLRLEPGTVLNVYMTDEAGAPVQGHALSLDDGATLAPIALPVVRTDAHGRAQFDRLSSGRYRLLTPTSRSCNGRRPLVIERRVTVPAGGTFDEAIGVGGVSLRLLLTTAGVPLPAAQIGVSPDSSPAAPPAWLRNRDLFPFPGRAPVGSFESACIGAAGPEGRASFEYVPSGPSRVALRLGDSQWTRRISVPIRGGELALDVPPGFLPVRVLSTETGEPVRGAALSWSSGGSRVEAMTSATGDVLLQGVADVPGKLTIQAPGHEDVELTHVIPDAGTPTTVAMRRSPDMSLTCRVLTDTGQPVAFALVELTPFDPLEATQIAMTDDAGAVRFDDLSPGGARIAAGSEGYAPAAISVAVPRADGVTITIKRSDQFRSPRS